MMATRPETAARPGGAGEHILRGHRRFALLPFLGPAFIACIAYIDPGNFATNIAAGSKFGYTLLWVILASNLMAMLIQTLSAKLGIATGRNLPEVCREHFSHRTTIGLWIQAELIAMATDLAEFLGAALGFNLLFGIGALPRRGAHGHRRVRSSSALQRFGFRPLEATIAGFIGRDRRLLRRRAVLCAPAARPSCTAHVVPAVRGQESLLLAVGILGATVMPHVIYLHSALTAGQDRPRERRAGAAAVSLHADRRRDRDVDRRADQHGDAHRSPRATFHGNGLTDVDSIEGAHQTLEPILGSAPEARSSRSRCSSSGLSSSAVGTLSGQVVMQGSSGGGSRCGAARGDDDARLHRDRDSGSTRRGRSCSARSCSRSASRLRCSRWSLHEPPRRHGRRFVNRRADDGRRDRRRRRCIIVPRTSSCSLQTFGAVVPSAEVADRVDRERR